MNYKFLLPIIPVTRHKSPPTAIPDPLNQKPTWVKDEDAPHTHENFISACQSQLRLNVILITRHTLNLHHESWLLTPPLLLRLRHHHLLHE